MHVPDGSADVKVQLYDQDGQYVGRMLKSEAHKHAFDRSLRIMKQEADADETDGGGGVHHRHAGSAVSYKLTKKRWFRKDKQRRPREKRPKRIRLVNNGS